MEVEVGPTAVAAAATTNNNVPTAASPPDGADLAPVGSPEDTLAEVPVLPSDDDHDHIEDPDHDHEQPSRGTVRSNDLKNKIIKQVEYYFSDENLQSNKHMVILIQKHKDGCVPITIISSFRKMKKLTRDHSFIASALMESSFLVVSSDGKRVKRHHPFPFGEVKDPKFCTVLVENLPEDHSVQNIQKIFGEAGKIRNISIQYPHAMKDKKKGRKADLLISSKLHALVEYEFVEDAERAVGTLNDEQDWRNGMRVKLLKQMGKQGKKKRAWKESDSDKNNIGRASNHTGDEENHILREHHDDTADEEEGEHLSKEKNVQLARNWGRPRRNRYHATLGLGHGSTSHGIEQSKPPPRPKMPDGTRGFTVGRGRPPVPNQNQQAI